MSRPLALGPLLPLLLSMVSLCVGTSIAKSLFPVAGPAGMTAMRIGLSALLLAAVQRPWRWRLDAGQARAVAAYGVVLAAMNLTFYAAVARLPLGIAIAIEFLGPLGVAVAGSRRAVDFGWVALAAGGVALLVLPGSGGHAVDPIGVGWALVAALCWAGYILLGKHATAIVPQHRIVCLGLIVAALVAVPVGVAEAGVALLRPSVLLSGLAVAVLCSALPYPLELAALKRLPARVFGIGVSLDPAIGALAALAVLGERLGAWQLAGIAAVTAASIGATLARRRPAIAEGPVGG